MKEDRCKYALDSESACYAKAGQLFVLAGNQSGDAVTF